MRTEWAKIPAQSNSFVSITYSDQSRFSVADLHSKILDPAPIQILSISCSFWEDLAKSCVAPHPPEKGWCPHLREILDPPLAFFKSNSAKFSCIVLIGLVDYFIPKIWISCHLATRQPVMLTSRGLFYFRKPSRSTNHCPDLTCWLLLA